MPLGLFLWLLLILLLPGSSVRSPRVPAGWSPVAAGLACLQHLLSLVSSPEGSFQDHSRWAAPRALAGASELQQFWLFSQRTREGRGCPQSNSSPSPAKGTPTSSGYSGQVPLSHVLVCLLACLLACLSGGWVGRRGLWEESYWSFEIKQKRSENLYRQNVQNGSEAMRAEWGKRIRDRLGES